MKKLLSFILFSFMLSFSALAELPSPAEISQKLKIHYNASQEATIAVSKGGYGTGVIISEDGLLLTAAHMFRSYEKNLKHKKKKNRENAGVMNVTMRDGTKYKANLLGFNRASDIALMRIENPENKKFSYAQLRTEVIKLGEITYLLGHPSGLYKERPAQLRCGRVTSVSYLEPGKVMFFMCDSNIQPGDSGGPMFDLEGRLVGINSSAAGVIGFNRFASISRFLDERKRYEDGEKWGDEKQGPVGGGSLSFSFSKEQLQVMQGEMQRRMQTGHRATVTFVQKHQKNGKLAITQQQLAQLFLNEAFAIQRSEKFSLGLDDPEIVKQIKQKVADNKKSTKLYDEKQIFAQCYPWNSRVVIAKASQLEGKGKIFLVQGTKGFPLEKIGEDKENDIAILTIKGKGRLKGFKLPEISSKTLAASDLLYAFDKAGLMMWGIACDSARAVDKGRTIGPLQDKTLISKRRDKFTKVVTHNLPLYAKDALTPMFAANGKLAGLHIARQNRTLALLIPMKEVKAIVEKLIKASGRRDLEDAEEEIIIEAI